MLNKTVASVFIVFLITPIGAVSIDFAQANPYLRDERWTDVPPPAGSAPIIAIHTPQNGSYYQKNVNLTLDVIIPKTNGTTYSISELYYVGSWKPNEVTYIEKRFGGNTSFSVDLTAVPGGNLSLTLYAVGAGFYVTNQELSSEPNTMITYFDKFQITSHSTVNFIKDLVPPRISVQSPRNTTYTTPDIQLDFTVNDNVSQSLYNLDNKGNQTISGNSTLTDLPNGVHNITFYAADLAGNAADPKTINFSVDVPEPFPTLLVAVSIAVVVLAVLSVGLLLSRNPQKHTLSLNSGS